MFSSFVGLNITSSAETPNEGMCGDNISYRYTNNNGIGVLTISGSGSMYNYSSKSPFSGNTSIQYIIVNDSVKSIGDYAFNDCSGLISVSLPDSIRSIGKSAFFNCDSMTEIELPHSLTSISEKAFSDCDVLSSISIPQTVNSLGANVFENCKGLIDVGLSNGITQIPHKAFKDCSNLSNISLPDSLLYICSHAFWRCESLSSITIPDSVRSIGEHAFRDCTNLEKLIIGNGTNIIDDYAFNNCSKLTELTLPVSAKICNSPHTFYKCSNIEKVTFTKGTGIMQNYYSDTGSTDTYIGYTPWNISRENIEEIHIEGAYSIGNSAFERCSGLQRVTISDSVTSIGNYAFEHCKGLTSITIPDSVTNIGICAFKGCSGLTNVTIGNAVTSIDDCAFEDCNCLNMVNITNLKSWCNVVFNNYSSNPLYYAHYLYLNGEKISELEIPSSVTSIGNSAFRNCSGLTNVIIPDSVTTIGGSAFYGCSDLTGVTLPETLKTIGISAFQNCSNLKNIRLPNSVTNVGQCAFAGCTDIDFIEIGTGLEIISVGSFFGCNSLAEVVIPNNIKYIESEAFMRCSNLEKVTIGEGVVSIDKDAFLETESLEKIYLLSNVINSTQNLISSMKTGSTLFAYPSTDAQVYCNIYGVNLVAITEPDCEMGYHKYDVYRTEPTCTDLGTVEYHCKFCDYMYSEAVPALGHTYKDEIVDPTCLQNGYTIHTCIKCGDSFSDNETEATGHSKVIDEAINPTCQKTGLTEGSHCAVCGDILEPQNIIPVVNHQYSENVVEATCIQQGYTLHSCIWCSDYYKTDFIEATDIHSYVETITTPATCSKEGVKTFTCSICGDSYTRSIAMTEHTPVVDKAVAPTCTNAGLAEGSHCSVCGYVITEQAVVQATGHSYNAVVTAATCKDKGYTTHTCTVCGDSYKDTVTQTTDEHDYKSTITTLATCSKEGVETFTCTICGDKYTKSIAMIEHTPVADKAVAPTCTKAGLTEGSHCSVCGYVITEQAVVLAKSHSYTASVTKDSSCSQAGIKTYTCTICGDKYTEAIPLKTHTIVSDNALEPTCTKYGLTEEKYCSVCGKVFETQEKIEPLGHDFGSVVTPATLTANGVITHPCSRCDKAEASEVIYAPRTFTLAKTSYVYTGKAIAPALTVKDSKGKTLVKGTDYDVIYKNNINIGTASLVITFKNNYEGTKELKFTILPVGTTITKLSPSSKAFTTQWKANKTVTGYQIQYGLKSNFSSAKTVTVKNAKTLKTTVKKLNAKKVYYVRIRTYKTVSKANYFSAWSKIYKVKTK